jgi:hypothetical protein
MGLVGIQGSISKQINQFSHLDEGWTFSGGFAGSVYGATVEFGGGVSGHGRIDHEKNDHLRQGIDFSFFRRSLLPYTG